MSHCRVTTALGRGSCRESQDGASSQSLLRSSAEDDGSFSLVSALFSVTLVLLFLVTPGVFLSLQSFESGWMFLVYFPLGIAFLYLSFLTIRFIYRKYRSQ